ncbi:hypothetical protein ACFL09_04465 [Planctomycetota bacterium]
MGSTSVRAALEFVQGKDIYEVATRLAKREGYHAVVWLKKGGDWRDDRLGCCVFPAHVSGYLASAYSVNPEVIYSDGTIAPPLERTARPPQWWMFPSGTPRTPLPSLLPRRGPEEDPDPLPPELSSPQVYVDQCLHWGGQESRESRDGFAMQDVRQASVLGSGHGTDKDVQLAWTLIAKYPDLDMPYYWLSHHCALRSNLGEARDILDKGLATCKRKRLLCVEYAWVECEAGRLLPAVKWWLRSAVLEVVSGRPISYEPFMYLAYLAAMCGLPGVAERLFAATDAVRSCRLSADGEHQLRRLLHDCYVPTIATVLDRFAQEYF